MENQPDTVSTGGKIIVVGVSFHEHFEVNRISEDGVEEIQLSLFRAINW